MNKFKIFLKSIKPIHLIFAGALITMMGSLLPSYNVFLSSTPFKINIITIFGAILSAIAAFYHHSASSTKTSEILRNSISNLKQIQDLTTQNADLSVKSTNILTNTTDNLKQVQELTAQNAILTLKLSDVTIKLSDLITGGNNICIMFFTYNHDTMEIFINALNNGESPLYDVNYRILDIDGIKSVDSQLGLITEPKMKRKNRELYKVHEKFGMIGNIAPKTCREGGYIGLNLHSELRTFRIELDCRNGVFIQDILMAYVEGEWFAAYQIYRSLAPETILLADTANGFPEAKLKWEQIV